MKFMIQSFKNRSTLSKVLLGLVPTCFSFSSAALAVVTPQSAAHDYALSAHTQCLPGASCPAGLGVVYSQDNERVKSCPGLVVGPSTVLMAGDCVAQSDFHTGDCHGKLSFGLPGRDAVSCVNILNVGHLQSSAFQPQQFPSYVLFSIEGSGQQTIAAAFTADGSAFLTQLLRSQPMSSANDVRRSFSSTEIRQFGTSLEWQHTSSQTGILGTVYPFSSWLSSDQLSSVLDFHSAEVFMSLEAEVAEMSAVPEVQAEIQAQGSTEEQMDWRSVGPSAVNQVSARIEFGVVNGAQHPLLFSGLVFPHEGREFLIDSQCVPLALDGSLRIVPNYCQYFGRLQPDSRRFQLMAGHAPFERVRDLPVTNSQVTNLIYQYSVTEPGIAWNLGVMDISETQSVVHPVPGCIRPALVSQILQRVGSPSAPGVGVQTAEILGRNVLSGGLVGTLGFAELLIDGNTVTSARHNWEFQVQAQNTVSRDGSRLVRATLRGLVGEMRNRVVFSGELPECVE